MKRTELLTLGKILGVILSWSWLVGVQAAPDEAAAADDIFIAGVHPEQRPANAPVISKCTSMV